MNSSSLSFLARRLGTRPWTCNTCRVPAPQFIKPAPRLTARRFASNGRNGSSHGGQRRPRKALLFASGSAAAAGVTAFAFVDDIKGVYEAAQRSGRVLGGLAICINE